VVSQKAISNQRHARSFSLAQHSDASLPACKNCQKSISGR